MMKRLLHKEVRAQGFALVVTISLMVLLSVIALGLLGLSAVALRTSSQGSARAEARANARLALLLAIGELQKEMGPDMRVSGEAALFDENPETESIEGVAQPHWLASYDSWGDWLTAEYTLPEGGGTLKIADTYHARREPMFRRWLVSLPRDMVDDIEAPLQSPGWSEDESVVLVGEGSLGKAAQSRPELVTRGYLVPVGERGRQAWWIGPENHKAKIDLASQPRDLDVDEWELAQGDTAEVGVGAIDGFDSIDGEPALSGRLISRGTLGPAGVDAEDVGKHFHDLTAFSKGVLASVRTGRLKKDLSLLFETGKDELPVPYHFDSGGVREPSIRPMSPELLAKRPRTTGRHFASWTGMRHFYRMYRRDSDAEAPSMNDGGTGGSPALSWKGSRPYTDYVGTSDCFKSSGSDWDGRDSYLRVPVLAKLTFIHSLMTEPAGNSNGQQSYRLYLVYTPVYTYWNPYNTELRIPAATRRSPPPPTSGRSHDHFPMQPKPGHRHGPPPLVNNMKDPFNILIPLRLEDVDMIWTTLRNQRFEFAERHYAYFTAHRDGLHVTVYQNGPKALVQGNGAGKFVEDVLEPLVADGFAVDIEPSPRIG